jgi:excisionase family DNA binding protein
MPRSATQHRQLTLVSVEEAAAYLGLNVRTIRRYIADGKLPAYRVGTTLIRVDQADVDALIQLVPAAVAAGR